MPRRIPAALRWALLVALLGAVVVSIGQSWMASSATAGGWTQTQWGPLGPADRDLLQKVRLAGLWEGPTGQQAQQQALSPAVKEVGGKLAVEHAQLDTEVRKTADKLGVLLPSRPSDQQLGWMNQLSGLTGSDYDRQFTQIVRAAHGQVLPLIAQVRAGTRNEEMRRFANIADQFVSRHCIYLESTGLVDYSALPAPPEPTTASTVTPSGLIVPALVVLGALLAAIGLLTTLRRRNRPEAPRPNLLRRPLRALGGRALLPSPRGIPEAERIPAPPPPQDPVTSTGSRRAVVGPPDPWAELGNAPQQTGRRRAHVRPDRPSHPEPQPLGGHRRRDTTWS